MLLKKNEAEIVVFMPSIENEGGEKNLFLICNFLSKTKKLSLITASNNHKSKFVKKIKYISPKSSYWNSRGRILKYITSSFY
tara:strand:+ start:618 stop:863 length:246 start_codon:yes stop_codon:yes gene_type:complete